MNDAMVKESECLAVEGGTPAVAAAPPESWSLGPAELGDEEIDAVTRVLRNKTLFRFGRPRSASPTAQFEDLFCELSGARHCLAVNSGTSALIAGLIGLGIRHGDEVLVPAYTYIASAAAVVAVGAFPVVVEVDDSLTMDPADLEKKITSRSRVIMPVHMRGVPCEMAAILAVAKKYDLRVLEDCAQANGGTFRGTALGTLGDAGAFSLQYYKIVTAGEGGAILTNNKEVYERSAIYHDCAYAFWMEGQAGDEQAKKDWRSLCFLGENFRQSEVHGAIALEQLKKRETILARTRAIKARLWEACQTLPGVRMEAVRDRAGDCGISLAFFMGSSAEAVRICEVLKAEGVRAGTTFSADIPNRHIFYHWDSIIEKRSAYPDGFPWSSDDREQAVPYSKEMCPRTIEWLERCVVMPIGQKMSNAYVDDVCAAIRKVARHWTPGRFLPVGAAGKVGAF